MKKPQRQQNWIRGAIRKPGALRRQAIHENAVTERETIRVAWLRKKGEEKGKTGQRARLALRLRRF